MGKSFLFFLIVFILASVGSGVMAGEVTFAATPMTASADNNDTTIEANTGDFPSAGKIQIDKEVIKYTAKDANSFNSCTRGYENTQAESHYSGTMVYQEELGILNNILGFDVVKVTSTYSIGAVIVFPLFIFIVTLPHLISINWNFLQGDWAFIGILWYTMLISLIVSIVVALRR